MPSNDVTTYLKYANLQMATESFLDDFTNGEKTLEVVLSLGNKRSSKFPDILAKDFAEHWKVVATKPNTDTGFSGTLFEAVVDDEALGYKKGEQVLSFRSTEFLDDNIRDNKATNELEIKEFGFAFGQIADMKKWVDSLKPTLKSPDMLAVTGYSLGGHLATAFNLLYPGVAGNTYTFNGAGVGIENGAKLADTLTQFERQRQNIDGNQITFSDPESKPIYLKLRTKLAGGIVPLQNEIFQATKMRNTRKSIQGATSC